MKEQSRTNQYSTEDFKQVNGLIKDIRIALLTTIDAAGNLHSRPMGTLDQKFEGSLWFLTGDSTYKVANLNQENRVNLAYYRETDSSYVSVSGAATLVRDPVKLKELWTPMAKNWFPKGVEDPELAALRVDVQEVNFWNSEDGKLTQMLGILKGVVTGDPVKTDGQAGHIKLGSSPRN